ncbi:MAG: mechanosensitive ion channel family protein, partial [Cyanobium sp.]
MGGVVGVARGWLKRWVPLGLVMAALILSMGFSAIMAAPAQKAAEGVPTPAWITLDGRKVLEVRVAAGAQTPQFVAERGSRIL